NGSGLTGGTSPSVSIAVTSLGGDAGRVQQTTDPRGIVSKTDTDWLGRTLRTGEAFSTFNPSGSGGQRSVPLPELPGTLADYAVSGSPSSHRADTVRGKGGRMLEFSWSGSSQPPRADGAEAREGPAAAGVNDPGGVESNPAPSSEASEVVAGATPAA